MRKKIWLIALLAAVLLIPGGKAKADAPLLISPAPGSDISVISPAPASDKPAWYPDSTVDFQFYNDANAPRVVDTADIFTDEEETAIAKAISEQSVRGNADIVVVTDDSAYGMSHMEYADDFYDYNGYGFGPDRDGIVLFICMEPGNRGWWTSVTGRLDPNVSNDRVLYTESVSRLLDNRLYEYLVAGRFAEGVLDWVGNVGTWLVYGTPFVPMWYPTVEEQSSWVREKNPNAPRISDSAGWFSKSEAKELEKTAAEISERYGVDVVIHTARSDCGMGTGNYAKAFYQYGGYGLYSDFSGVLLVMFDEDLYYTVYTEGDLPSVFDDYDAMDRLTERSENAAYKAGSAYAGAEEYLKTLDKALKSNKVAKGTGSWIFSGVLSALAGLLSGTVSRGSAAASMKTVRTAFDSNDYLVDGSFKVLHSYDKFVGVTTTRVYSPPQQKQQGGDAPGGGVSTFNGGHISSSGSSHSGSGGKF